MDTPLVLTGNLPENIFSGRTALVTGAGRGIGFETARGLAWLGAKVILAEIDARTGSEAADRIQAELGAGRAEFVHADISDEGSVRQMAEQVFLEHESVYAVINNATVAPVGYAVQDTDIHDWDRSYQVNLRGPVLLARAFLPQMIARNSGVFVCVSSAGAAPFMGPYEVFKTAQVELAATLAAELEDKDVIAFTIGPGIVRTPGALAAIERLAPLYGHTLDSFFAMNEAHLLSEEAAGAGFAAAVALAPQFRGQEISSIQALIAAGIELSAAENRPPHKELAPDSLAEAAQLCASVRQTLEEQSKGWQERNLFERQWVVRDFKKYSGMPVEGWLDGLARMELFLERGNADEARGLGLPLARLAGYYAHLQELAKGYEKDSEKLAANLRVVQGWQEEVEQLDFLQAG